MRPDFYPSDEDASEGVVAPLLSSPADVLRDCLMPKEAKRALLAGWASDRRAVENRPALRRLDDGTLLHIDDILDALKALDGSAWAMTAPQNILPFSRPGPSRAGYDANSDGDDDPPPRPMALRAAKRRQSQTVPAWPRGGAYAVA